MNDILLNGVPQTLNETPCCCVGFSNMVVRHVLNSFEENHTYALACPYLIARGGKKLEKVLIKHANM